MSMALGKSGWLALTLAGAAGTLLACELLLRALPVSSATFVGYHLDPLILSYPAHFEWTSSTGWDLRNAQRSHTNNAGFVGRRDLERRPEAIALIGDSFIEASMLPPADRPAEQLEHALASAPVYALGMPGSALLDYAERMRWAQQHYGLRRFVLLLESGDLKQSLCGSGNVHGPCLDPQTFAPRTESKPPPDALKRLLRHSALAQYLSGQIKLNPQQLWRQAVRQARAPVESPAAPPAPKTSSTEAARAASPASVAVTQAFLARIRALDLQDLVIVLDADRDAIYAGRDTSSPDQQAFAAALRQAGATVIEGRPLFEQHYRLHGLKFDVGPYDKHLNALGLGLLMNAAAKSLGAQP